MVAAWGCQTIPESEADRTATPMCVGPSSDDGQDPAVKQFSRRLRLCGVSEDRHRRTGAEARFGRGQVFLDDELVGYKVTEGTIGAQVGGSNYSR